MVSSELCEPKSIFVKGLIPEDLNTKFGHSLTFWNWNERTVRNKVDLGLKQGLLPLEVRFLHDPNKDYGYVGCSVSGTLVRFFPGKDGNY